MFTGIPSLLDDISNRPTHQPSPRTPRKKKEEPEGNEVEISIATIIPFVFLGAVLGMWLWCYLRRRKREREIEALGDFLRAQIKNNKREGANPASTIATNMPLLSASATLRTEGVMYPTLGSTTTKDSEDIKMKLADIEIQSNPKGGITDFRKGLTLGKGAFGEVCMGLELATGRLMAVKSVPLKMVQKSSVESFLVEVNLLKTLNHPNVVRYLDAREDGEYLYIFLEFVSGGSLASVLRQFGPLTPDLSGMFTCQILQGLHYLHGQGIAHRDIKAANCLCTKEGLVKIADFGVSKRLGKPMLEEEKPATGISAWMGIGRPKKSKESLRDIFKGAGAKTSLHGTPAFMAPEVVKQEPSGFPADVWAVGCTVIEMMTGKAPWVEHHRSMPALLLAIGKTTGPPPEVECLPETAKDFVMLCMKVKAVERPSTKILLDHPFVSASNKKRRSESNTKNIDLKKDPDPVAGSPREIKRLGSIKEGMRASRLLNRNESAKKEASVGNIGVTGNPSADGSIDHKSDGRRGSMDSEDPLRIESSHLKAEQPAEPSGTDSKKAMHTGVLKTQQFEMSW